MRRFRLLLAVGSVLWLAACGSSNNATTITGVTAICLPSPIQSSQLIGCSATVTGTGNVHQQRHLDGKRWVNQRRRDLHGSGRPRTYVGNHKGNFDAEHEGVGTATVVIDPVNLQPLTVDAGPQPQTFTTINEAFTSVTVCVPNSTTCQTIDHVLVDTGSSGLRLLSSVLTIPLPQQNDSSGNPLDECTVFLDGYVWGPVSLADISLAGETGLFCSGAGNDSRQLPLHPSRAVVPARTIGPNEGVSVSALRANGVLGVGLFHKIAELACTTANGSIPPVYYDCPASGCNPTYVTLAQQVPNPVTMFVAR